jgi:hypothetical protein
LEIVTSVSGELAASIFRVYVVQNSDPTCHEDLCSQNTGSSFGAFNSCYVISDGKSTLFTTVLSFDTVSSGVTDRVVTYTIKKWTLCVRHSESSL